MTHWLIARPKTVRLLTIGASFIGYLLFLYLAKITFDLHILLPLFAITAIISYLFGYSWPFLGALVIDCNRRWLGVNFVREESLAKFLLWFALFNLPVGVIFIIAGNAMHALGLSSACGLLAGCCQYLSHHQSN